VWHSSARISLKIPCHFLSHSLLFNFGKEVGCMDDKMFSFFGEGNGLNLAVYFLDDRKELRVQEPSF